MALLLLALLSCTTAPDDKAPAPGDTAPEVPATRLPTFEGDAPRNLLMISIDTLRKDHLSRYDPHERDLTPFLDGLMDDGFVLDDHLTCSNWTFVGITCTLLGRNHTEVGFIPQLEPPAQRIPWPAGQRFLADWLRDAGFATVLASANGYLSRDWGTGDGYDRTSGVAFDPATTISAQGVADLEAALAEGADRWFLHLHYLEPHAPYLEHEGFTPDTSDLDPVPFDLTVKPQHYDAAGEWPRLTPEEQANLLAHLTRRYQGEVAYLDDHLRQVFDDLRAKGLLDDTLVVVWSDHGEAFWEHGHQSHAWTLHRPENDGIAFFWSDGIVPGAWSGPTHATDLVPTLLGLLSVPEPVAFSGVPVGLASADRPRFAATVARAGVQQSVQVGPRKLLYAWGGSAGVYDLRTDPGELTPRWDPTDPEHLALWTLLAPQVGALEPLVVGFPPPATPEGAGGL